MDDRETAIIDKICDQQVEKERGTYQGKLEPFEVYAQRTKEKLKTECKNYVEHLRKGYESIMKKLKSES